MLTPAGPAALPDAPPGVARDPLAPDAPLLAPVAPLPPGAPLPAVLAAAVPGPECSPPALQSPGVAGLYPCGEGAGYVGGIVSAVIDGRRVADAILAWVSAGLADDC